MESLQTLLNGIVDFFTNLVAAFKEMFNKLKEFLPVDDTSK